MTHPPFTQAWADAFREAVNASESFRAVGSAWRWPVALVLDRAPELGYADDHVMLLELEEGECRRAELVDAASVDAPFVIGGPYAVWKEVVLGRLDPIAAIMRRQMRLKGSIATLVQHLATAKALVGCASLVPTRFPDEG
jgi:putative sterol carrier protein